MREEPVWCLDSHPIEENMIVSVGMDGYLRLFDEEQMVGKVANFIQVLMFAPGWPCCSSLRPSSRLRAMSR